MYTIKKLVWYKNEKGLFVVRERRGEERARVGETSIVRDDTHS